MNATEDLCMVSQVDLATLLGIHTGSIDGTDAITNQMINSLKINE